VGDVVLRGDRGLVAVSAVGVVAAAMGGVFDAPLFGVAIVLAVAAAAFAWQARRLERLTIEPMGVRVGEAFTRWSAIAIEGTPHAIRMRVDGVGIFLARPNVRNWDEVYGALRQRCAPELWRVQERARRAPHAGFVIENAAVHPARATYREPAREEHAFPSWWPAEPRSVLRVAALGGLLLVAASLLLPHTAVRPSVRTERTFVPDAALAQPPVSLLVGRGIASAGVLVSMVAVLGAMGAWIGGRPGRRARDWLGAGAIAERRGARSADGSRRARLEPVHAHAIGPHGLVLEELDARGLVARSHGILAAAPAGLAVRSRWVASLARDIDSARHEMEQRSGDGTTRSLPCGPARVLVLDVRDDGVMLVRFTATRFFAGATRHASRLEAEAQIADEYGVRDLDFRECPVDGGALAFFAHA
jgi:hypothetical protein